MAVKPAIHGRDHCPNGADPIPCLPSAWGRAEFTTDQTFSTSSKQIEWDTIEVAPQQSDILANTALTPFQFATEGFWAVRFWAQWSGADSWAAGEVRYMQFSVDSAPPLAAGNPVIGPKQTHPSSNRVQSAEHPCWYVPIVGPSDDFFCTATQLSGANRTLTQGGVTVLLIRKT